MAQLQIFFDLKFTADERDVASSDRWTAQEAE